MKKTLLVLSMVALSSVAMAQKGSWYAGGQVGFGSSTDKDANDKKDVTSTWNFNPEVGTFLKDDIQLGLVLGLGGSKSKFDGDETGSTTRFSPTVYGRKFFKVTDQFSTFAGLYLSLISEKNIDKTTGYEVEMKSNGFGAKVGVGCTYALSPRFTAVGHLGLLNFQSVNNKVEGNDAGKSAEFGLDVNTFGAAAFNVGVYYTFMQ
jgi:hypothetical protein